MLIHYRGRWPEDPIPEGEPIWLFYEVDPAQDVVLRAIDLFEDGRSERNSLQLEERDGFPCISIVHGPFMPTVVEAQLEPILPGEFEALWCRSVDKPFP